MESINDQTESKGKRKKTWLWLILLAVIVLGGGYFAYSQGFIKLPCSHEWIDITEIIHHETEVVHHEAEYKTVHKEEEVLHHDSEYMTTHHEAEYTTIHHEAKTIHHDAENKTIHHEAEVIHHDAEVKHVHHPAGSEQVYVVDKEAWDEIKLDENAYVEPFGNLASFTVYPAVAVCHGCKAILANSEELRQHFDLEYHHPEVIPILARMREIDAIYEADREEGLKYRDEYIGLSNEYTRISDEFFDLHYGHWGPADYFIDTSGNRQRFVGTENYDAYHEALRANMVTVHHPEEGHYETRVYEYDWDQYILVKEAWDEEIKPAYDEQVFVEAYDETVPAYDERKLVKEAWDEQTLVKEAYDEIVPEHDEQIVVKEAWDEIIKEAWDEEVITGQKCSKCGKPKE